MFEKLLTLQHTHTQFCEFPDQLGFVEITWRCISKCHKTAINFGAEKSSVKAKSSELCCLSHSVDNAEWSIKKQ